MRSKQNGASRFFLKASSQNFKNGAIVIIQGSFSQRKDSLQLDRFQFLKIESIIIKIQKFIYKNVVLENCFSMVLAIKEFIFIN